MKNSTYIPHVITSRKLVVKMALIGSLVKHQQYPAFFIIGHWNTVSNPGFRSKRGDINKTVNDLLLPI